MLVGIAVSADSSGDVPPPELAAVYLSVITLPVIGIGALLGAADGDERVVVFESAGDDCRPPPDVGATTGAGRRPTDG